MGRFPKLLLFLSLLFAPLAQAVPSLSPRIKDKEIRVGAVTNTYLTKSRETRSDAGTGNLGLSIGIRALGHKNDFHFGIEADSLYGLRNANYRYLDIAEAYMGFDRKTFFSYFGRKRYDWNSMDSYWGLGLYQPRFRWDYLNEKENGLFGLFLGTEQEYFQATAYYAPIFIPETGAPFDIDGGTCKTSSPWFTCPSSSISLFNQSTDVRFSLDIPPVKDLIQKWGAGTTLRFGRNFGPYGRLAYAHKPMNQLLLGYEGRLDLSTLQIPAVIRPRTLYHDLFGLDFGWNAARHGFSANAIWEKPKYAPTPANLNTQEVSDAFVSGFIFKTMPFSGSFKHTRLEFSFLHREGGNAPDQGPFAQQGSSIFEPRYAFRTAYSASIFTPILDRWARFFLSSVKFIFENRNNGNILQADLHYRPLARVYLNLGVDLLGSETREALDFISRYQRNDRLRGGVTYVF